MVHTDMEPLEPFFTTTARVQVPMQQRIPVEQMVGGWVEEVGWGAGARQTGGGIPEPSQPLQPPQPPQPPQPSQPPQSSQPSEQ